MDRTDFKGIFSETREDNGQTKALHLDRFHTEVLITGYDVNRRAAVIRRWHDLESKANQQPKLESTNCAMPANLQIDEIHIAANTCRALRLSASETVDAMMASVTSPTALKVLTAVSSGRSKSPLQCTTSEPEPEIDFSILKSSTHLLREAGLTILTTTFHSKLAKAGILRKMASGTGYQLTKEGEAYGRTTHAGNASAPRWIPSKFNKLLELVK